VENREGGGEFIQLVPHDLPADLDHSEARFTAGGGVTVEL
jgi:hypothetical protein